MCKARKMMLIQEMRGPEGQVHHNDFEVFGLKMPKKCYISFGNNLSSLVSDSLGWSESIFLLSQITSEAVFPICSHSFCHHSLHHCNKRAAVSSCLAYTRIVTVQKNFQPFQTLLEQTWKAALAVKTTYFLLQRAKWCRDIGSWK